MCKSSVDVGWRKSWNKNNRNATRRRKKPLCPMDQVEISGRAEDTISAIPVQFQGRNLRSRTFFLHSAYSSSDGGYFMVIKYVGSPMTVPGN